MVNNISLLIRDRAVSDPFAQIVKEAIGAARSANSIFLLESTFSTLSEELRAALAKQIAAI